MKSPTVSRAGRRRRLRRSRPWCREADDQHAHPRAEGRRRHRHPRAADLQDRPLSDAGRRHEFDARGRHDRRRRAPFHCADRRRHRHRVGTGPVRLRSSAATRRRIATWHRADRRRHPHRSPARWHDGDVPRPASRRAGRGPSWRADGCRGGGWSPDGAWCRPRAEQAERLGRGRRRAGRALRRTVQSAESGAEAPLIWTKAADLAFAHRGASAEPVAEPRPGSRRRRWPARPRAGRAARRDRWMAASSYRPMAWLATTCAAGTSARPRPGLVELGPELGLARRRRARRARLVGVRCRRPARRRRRRRRPVLAAGCPQAAHRALTYPGRQPRRSGALRPAHGRAGPHPATVDGCVRVDVSAVRRPAHLAPVADVGFPVGARIRSSWEEHSPLHRSEQP